MLVMGNLMKLVGWGEPVERQAAHPCAGGIRKCPYDNELDQQKPSVARYLAATASIQFSGCSEKR